MEKEAFKITNKHISLVNNSNSMEDWLSTLDKKELRTWAAVCYSDNKEKEAEEQIITFALTLFCLELGTKNIILDDEFKSELSNRFCMNVVMHDLVKRGLAKLENHLYMYKDSCNKITPTNKVNKFFKEYKRNKKK